MDGDKDPRPDGEVYSNVVHGVSAILIALVLSVAVNAALFVALISLNADHGLQMTMAPRTSSMTALRPAMMSSMHPRMATYAKKVAEVGMVPDRNSRPDDDIVPRDGSIWDKVFNEWITKKSPTRSLVLDRQREMNEERAQGGGLLDGLATLSLPSIEGGGLPEINLDGLSDLSIDPTLKRTTKQPAKTVATGRKTAFGKKAAPAPEPEQKGFQLPSFLKPYDSGKLSYSEMLNKKGGRN